MSWIKPGLDDRVNWTVTKEERAAFVARIEALGVPILDFTGLGGSFEMIKLLNIMLDKIEALEKQ